MLSYGGQIAAGTFGAGVVIYHINGIVVNGYSQIGTNCKLHGITALAIVVMLKIVQ